MLKIWKDSSANILFRGVFILLFLVIVTIPTVRAQYRMQAESFNQARVAKFDIEVVTPNDWIVDDVNEVVFTQVGSLESTDIPFKVINRSEVKVRCIILAYYERFDITVEVERGEIDIDSEEEFYAVIPESSVGEVTFELIILVEQIGLEE